MVGFNAMLSRQDDVMKRIQDLQAGQDRIRVDIRKLSDSLNEFDGVISRGRSRAVTRNLSSRFVGTDSFAAHGETDLMEDRPWIGRSVSSEELLLSGSPRSFRQSASGITSEALASCLCPKQCCGVNTRPAFRQLCVEAQGVVPFTASLGKTAEDLEALAASLTVGASPTGQRCPSARCYWLRPIHPDSMVRLFLDMAVILVLIFDSVSVPYQISFNPDVTASFWLIGNLMTLLVWSLDLCAGFFTGYYDMGGVVMNVRKITKRYLSSFFIIDLLTVGTDWLSMTFNLLIISGSTLVDGNGNNTTFLKLFRVLKLNRMIRLVGALQSGKFGQLHDRLISWSWQLGVDRQLQFGVSVMYLTFAVLWLNHIGCCFWNAIYDEGVRKWEGQAKIFGEDPATDTESHRSDMWQYCLGFYWSMTSMASGSSIMNPTNMTELVFTISYVLFGLLVGSSLISSLAAMLLDLQMNSKEKRDSIRRLRQYLYQQGLEVGLSLAVEKEVVSRISQEKRLGANEVECLALLSAAMRSSLNYAIYCKPLRQHSFLGACDVLDRSGVFTRELCEYAVCHATVRPGHPVFTHGEHCDGPFYIVLGELEYLCKAREPDVVVQSKRASKGESKEQHVTVKTGQWLCEMAIWLEWKCRGSLEACVPSEYFQLKADVLLQNLSQSQDLAFMARAYGEALCNAVETEESEPLTDLPLKEELHQSAVLSMPPQGRRGMSVAAVRLLESEQGRHRLTFGRSPPIPKLIEQVEQGKCDLVIVHGQVVRVVSVVVLRLERHVLGPDGKIVRQLLAQLGKSLVADDAKCQLPGGKVRAGELPGDALARLLGGQLCGLRGAGLRQEELAKVDGVIELTESAESGADELRVSSLADLIVSSVVQIEQERGKQSEVRTVTGIDRFAGQIELDRPLKHPYAARSRVTKASGSRSSSEYGVETKYIRSIFCCGLDERGQSLAAPGEWVRPLVRCARSHVFSHTVSFGGPRSPLGEAPQDPTADYEAFLLVPRQAEKSAGASAECAADDGIPCAWVHERDFAMLSSTQAGAEMVKTWVSELVLSAAKEEDSTDREPPPLPALSPRSTVIST